MGCIPSCSSNGERERIAPTLGLDLVAGLSTKTRLPCRVAGQLRIGLEGPRALPGAAAAPCRLKDKAARDPGPSWDTCAPAEAWPRQRPPLLEATGSEQAADCGEGVGMDVPACLCCRLSRGDRAGPGSPGTEEESSSQCRASSTGNAESRASPDTYLPHQTGPSFNWTPRGPCAPDSPTPFPHHSVAPPRSRLRVTHPSTASSAWAHRTGPDAPLSRGCPGHCRGSSITPTRWKCSLVLQRKMSPDSPKGALRGKIAPGWAPPGQNTYLE